MEDRCLILKSKSGRFALRRRPAWPDLHSTSLPESGEPRAGRIHAFKFKHIKSMYDRSRFDRSIGLTTNFVMALEWMEGT